MINNPFILHLSPCACGGGSSSARFLWMQSYAVNIQRSSTRLSTLRLWVGSWQTTLDVSLHTCLLLFYEPISFSTASALLNNGTRIWPTFPSGLSVLSWAGRVFDSSLGLDVDDSDHWSVSANDVVRSSSTESKSMGRHKSSTYSLIRTSIRWFSGILVMRQRDIRAGLIDDIVGWVRTSSRYVFTLLNLESIPITVRPS